MIPAISGSGGKKSGVTTHYLTSTDVSLDGQPERFVGSDSRPSINNVSDIAFLESIQPDFDRGIFVGPDPINDRVISTGDTLDGSTVQNIVFCEQDLSDSGELAFVAQLDIPETPEEGDFRTAVFRATPVSKGGLACGRGSLSGVHLYRTFVGPAKGCIELRRMALLWA